LEEIQETGELPAGSLRIVSWQSVNELPRSKLTGCQNIAMRIDLIPKASPPNVLIGGPVPVSPGFPIKRSGMTDARKSRRLLLKQQAAGNQTQ
jgi:hypothetical protein